MIALPTVFVVKVTTLGERKLCSYSTRARDGCQTEGVNKPFASFWAQLGRHYGETPGTLLTINHQNCRMLQNFQMFSGKGRKYCWIYGRITAASKDVQFRGVPGYCPQRPICMWLKWYQVSKRIAMYGRLDCSSSISESTCSRSGDPRGQSYARTFFNNHWAMHKLSIHFKCYQCGKQATVRWNANIKRLSADFVRKLNI